MTTRHISQSLIPYLDPDGSGIYLKICLRSEDQAVLEKTRGPFTVITDSGPITRIIEAQFTTNAGSRVKRVFLLVQKDEYRLDRNQLWPVNNLDIDRCWQKAFSRYVGDVRDDNVAVLSDQIGKEGGLLPFRPLFFCKAIHAFFHPPCPHCGSYLEQCYDDDLLAATGLEPYSTSLKRYLFCTSCLESSGQSDFYRVSVDGTDPQMIRDLTDLIRAFKFITEDRNLTGTFPCAVCHSRQECYGEAGLALSRIEPFSFYPFYMLIFNELSVNAIDFLALISGATLEEMEAAIALRHKQGSANYLNEIRQKGPIITPFMFDQDQRRFKAELMQELDDIREKIRTDMFRQDETVMQTGTAAEDRAISDILARIAERRQSDISEGLAEPAQPSVSEQEVSVIHQGNATMSDDGDVLETVILNSADLIKGGPMTFKREETLDKTVILTPPTGATTGALDQGPRDDTDLGETVILSPGPVAAGTPRDDGLCETVALSPSINVANRRPVGPAQIETDVPETVILSKNALGAKDAKGGSEEDSLDETVIIRPGKK